MNEYPEKHGYQNTPGFVKANPLNNDSYVEKFCDGVDAKLANRVKKTHATLSELVPGYNIVQIKLKFGELRYYITAPDKADPEVAKQAYDIAASA